MDRRAIGRELAACRREVGVTQRELASALNVPLGTVRGWEQGRRNLYTEEFFAICDGLGVDPTVLTRRLHAAVQPSGEVGFI